MRQTGNEVDARNVGGDAGSPQAGPASGSALPVMPTTERTEPNRTTATGARVLDLLSRSYLFVFLALTIVIGSALSPFFFTTSNLNNIMLSSSIISVLAVAQFMVIVTAGIDLSVGSVSALATVMAALLLRREVPLPVAIAGTLAVCALAGLINGGLIVYGRITPFIATLAMLSIARGVAYLIQTGTLIVIENDRFLKLFAGQIGSIPHPVVIFLLVTAVSAFVMRYTGYGRRLYAIGGNAEAARLSGLPVRRDILTVYTASGFLAGLAGLMLAGQLSQGSSLVGQGYELDSIAAAVVGGTSLFGATGDPISSVVGGLIIATIGNIMNLRGIPSEPQLVIRGLLILIAVFFTGGGGARILQAVRRSR